MIELILNKDRTCVYDLTLETESGTGVLLDTGDVVRIIMYRRPGDTLLLDLSSDDAANANGSSIDVTSTVPTPTGDTPTVRLNIGQADLEDFVQGTPVKIEVTVSDASGSPTNALMGPIHGYGWVIGTGTLP